MRKFFVTAMGFAMAVSLTACGNSSANGMESTTKSTTASAVSTTAGAAESTQGESGSAAEKTKIDIHDVWKPGTTVTFEVPAKAGGGTDLQTRYVTAALGEMFEGVNFIVNNYDVAEVGYQKAAQAAPDGLNLTLESCTNMNVYMSGSSEVNPKDMTIITKIHCGGANAWICVPDAPYSNMSELADYINEHPGELTIGCSLGGTSQLIWLNTLNDVDPALKDKVNFVQCSSEADKLTNIASGSINLSNCSVNNALGYMQDGKLKVLGIIGPEVATKECVSGLVGQELDDNFKSMPEQGINSIWDSGYYVSGPAGMDEGLVEAISEAVLQLQDSKTFMDGMAAMGQIVDLKGVEESRKDFDMEWDVNWNLLSDLGLLTR